ncbi:RNA-directed DNA polymerase, eukaryota, reverse transcriptase zinc-binding domain protein [Tanacetum coccineum]
MLVASVLESIHVYWAYVILLPDGVIKNINRILKNFLWNQNEGIKGRPKVAWKNVCKFKQKGGLGLKDLRVWNRAIIVKHLWHIVTDKESLWVKWVNTEKLKGRSIWEIKEDNNDSWGWRNLLKQRNDVRRFIISKLGNGGKTSLWFDNWSKLGPLNQFINYKAMYDGRLKANLTVKEWMEEHKGNWPDGWISKFPRLVGLQSIMLNEQANDEVKWKKSDGGVCEFTVNHAYRDFIAVEEDVKWWKVVWFSQNILKHAFIVWLAIQNKLTTQDKIKQWGSYDVLCCALCKNNTDSHSHLFFECGYSSEVWKNVVDKMDVGDRSYKWFEIVEEMSRTFNGNSINSIIRRLCLVASVYLIWQERNYRIFREEIRSPEELTKAIIDVVRMRLLNLKLMRSDAVIKAQVRWNVKLRIDNTLIQGCLETSVNARSGSDASHSNG